MTQKPIYFAILALSIFNGIYSKYTVVVFALQGLWYPVQLPAPFTFMLILSAAVTATLYFLGTGIAAALVEKLWPERKQWAAILWLVVMIVATYPTFQHLELV